MIERPVDISILTAFSPLDGLKAENLHALARKTQIRELDAGRALFKEGDTEKRTFYLVVRHRRAAQRGAGDDDDPLRYTGSARRRSRRACPASSPRAP